MKGTLVWDGLVFLNEKKRIACCGDHELLTQVALVLLKMVFHSLGSHIKADNTLY